jgi:hypothetical protein
MVKLAEQSKTDKREARRELRDLSVQYIGLRLDVQLALDVQNGAIAKATALGVLAEFRSAVDAIDPELAERLVINHGHAQRAEPRERKERS